MKKMIDAKVDFKTKKYISTKEYSIDEALKILNPDNRIPLTSEKRGAFNIIKKELERRNKNA